MVGLNPDYCESEQIKLTKGEKKMVILLIAISTALGVALGFYVLDNYD